MLEGRRIVLVEDDEIMGASLVQRLELEGAEVQWHRQILRALPAIRTPRKPVDAVICDIRLPDGTGEELYETLTRTGHPPAFLFITGQGSIDQAVRLIRSVIGVLPQDHHLDTVQLGQFEGIEHLGRRRIDDLARFPLLPDGRQGCLEIVLLFLRADHILPGQHASLLSL